MTTIGLDSLRQELQDCGQSHLLRFWQDLTDQQQKQLVAQIEQVDFDLLQRLSAGQQAEEDWSALAARSSEPSAIRLKSSVREARFNAEEARQRGEQMLREGRVAAVLVAGGQGSRLGFDHPKGMFPLGPVSNRTLFEIHVDRLRALAARFGVVIPLYLMTSPATHEETIEYMQSNEFLGLAESDVIVFCQGTMPAIDAQTGQVLLEAPDRLFLSPDGHGGTLAALDKAGCLEDMRQRGVDCLFYFQVDNPMVAIADPTFIGYHLLAESELTSQVVAKQDPLEKVGCVVSVDGKLRIIEYSDLPDTAAQERNADGSLKIWAGSIAVHAFDVGFLQRMRDRTDALPFHRALKKVPYIDQRGHRIDPDQPNAIKFERFIFDLLPSANQALVVEVAQSEGFAPLKNGMGAAADTAETCRAALVGQHISWLKSAGVEVADGVLVEINPRLAQDAQEVAAMLERGTAITKNAYLDQAK
jgi:UDP-N-acetylglucosamine/UDP-N-acetylgalactosamine diphosphorylase